MGIDAAAKKWFFDTFGEDAISDVPPSDAAVWVIDHTAALKFVPRDFHNGNDFLHQHFLKDAEFAFANGAKIVYLILDRGSPYNKGMEHEKRSKGVDRMPTPENDRDPSMVNDYRIPKASQWKSMIKNPYLAKRLAHYVTMRLIGTRGDIDATLEPYIEDTLAADYNDKLSDYSPSPRIDGENAIHGEKTLCLFGGRLAFPESNKPLQHQYPEPLLLTFQTITREIKSGRDGSLGGYETVRSVKARSSGIGYDERQLSNLLEGEVSAMFFALNHMVAGDNIVIVSPDGDTWMMLFQSCLDRIDKVTGKFNCNVYVRLQAGKSKMYVDVHRMWYNVHAARPSPPPRKMSTSTSTSTRRFRFTGIVDPCEWSTKLCSTIILSGTDYVIGYARGIGSNSKGLEKEICERAFAPEFLKTEGGRSLTSASIPWPIYVFLKYYYDDKGATSFGNFFTVRRTKKLNMEASMRKSVEIDLDEEKFIEFTRHLYIEKYGRLAKFKKKYGPSATYESVRTYLNGDKKEELEKTRAKEEEAIRRKNNPKVVTNGKAGKRAVALAPSPNLAASAATIEADKKNKARRENRIPTARNIRAWSRRFTWQLLYYLNSYRGTCEIVDPTTVFADASLYGYVVGKNGKCVNAKRVSPKATFPTLEKEREKRKAHEARSIWEQQQQQEQQQEQLQRWPEMSTTYQRYRSGYDAPLRDLSGDCRYFSEERGPSVVGWRVVEEEKEIKDDGGSISMTIETTPRMRERDGVRASLSTATKTPRAFGSESQEVSVVSIAKLSKQQKMDYAEAIEMHEYDYGERRHDNAYDDDYEEFDNEPCDNTD